MPNFLNHTMPILVLLTQKSKIVPLLVKFCVACERCQSIHEGHDQKCEKTMRQQEEPPDPPAKPCRESLAIKALPFWHAGSYHHANSGLKQPLADRAIRSKETGGHGVENR